MPETRGKPAHLCFVMTVEAGDLFLSIFDDLGLHGFTLCDALSTRIESPLFGAFGFSRAYAEKQSLRRRAVSNDPLLELPD
jgi:hypothetical protein